MKRIKRLIRKYRNKDLPYYCLYYKFSWDSRWIPAQGDNSYTKLYDLSWSAKDYYLYAEPFPKGFLEHQIRRIK